MENNESENPEQEALFEETKPTGNVKPSAADLLSPPEIHHGSFGGTIESARKGPVPDAEREKKITLDLHKKELLPPDEPAE